MTSKTIYMRKFREENKHTWIWMFPNQFQTTEVVKNIVELAYPMLFHLISLSMKQDMRKVSFLSK